jgi:hypothetical protein
MWDKTEATIEAEHTAMVLHCLSRVHKLEHDVFHVHNQFLRGRVSASAAGVLIAAAYQLIEIELAKIEVVDQVSGAPIKNCPDSGVLSIISAMAHDVEQQDANAGTDLLAQAKWCDTMKTLVIPTVHAVNMIDAGVTSEISLGSSTASTRQTSNSPAPDSFSIATTFSPLCIASRASSNSLC